MAGELLHLDHVPLNSTTCRPSSNGGEIVFFFFATFPPSLFHFIFISLPPTTQPQIDSLACSEAKGQGGKKPVRSCTEDKQQGVEAEEEQLHLQVCFGFHNVTFSLLWNAKTSAKVTLFKVFLLSSGIECEGGAESSELVRILER